MTSRTALPANPFPVPERALPPLTRLDEYEIERVLAQSSFAVVYRAYDPALKLHLAIKEYLPDALALRSAEGQVVPRSRSAAERFEAGRQAFVAEAQTLARCVHPSLLRVLRLIHANGTVYRVMPYAPGVTLLEYRRERAAAPSPAVLCQWLDGLLGALAALHDDGCVHGAVAPGNILRLADEQPLLLDFDAVRAALISDRTQSMMSALEPCFAPSEQTAPSAPSTIGPWTDLYAMAASLHFCVTGQLPATPGGDSAEEGRFESLVDHWQRHHEGAPLPQDLQRLYGALDACLAGEPARRPQGVAEFRALIGLARVARPVAAAAAVPGAAIAPPVEDRSPPPTVAPVPDAPAAPAPAGDSSDPGPADAAGARIIADLDQTFAAIAARANEPAAPGAPGSGPPLPAAAATPEALAEQPRGEAPAAPWAAEPPATRIAAATRPARRAAAAQGLAAALLLGLAIGAGLWWQSAPEGPRAAAQPAAEAPAGAAPAVAIEPGDAAPRAAVPAAPSAPPWVFSPAGAGAAASEPAAMAAKPAEAAVAAKPPPKKQAVRSKPALPESPADACGQRTQFALYRCMHTQCAQPKWQDHPQCQRLRRADELS